jgi:transposase
LFAAIRELAHREELSIRSLAERFEVHRRTVRHALAAPTPPPRKKHAYPAPRLDPVRALIDAMLTADPMMPAGHVWERLLDEHDVIASYSTVRKYLSEHRAGTRGRRRPPRPATLSR